MGWVVEAMPGHDGEGEYASAASRALTALGVRGQMRSMSVIVVKAAFDAEARVWYVESSDMAGLNVEAPSIESLRDKLPAAILDLIEVEGDDDDVDLPIELIAHASTRVVRRRETA